jgi:hypothetical protein
MIADFRFDGAPSDDQIVVQLYWDNDIRMGKIVVPSAVEDFIAENHGPAVEPLPIISALGYAVVLAGKSDHRLCLTGDRSVWDCHWGHLVEAH